MIDINDDTPILIAVEDEKIANEIRNELELKGVAKNLLVWKKPIHFG